MMAFVSKHFPNRRNQSRWLLSAPAIWGWLVTIGSALVFAQSSVGSLAKLPVVANSKATAKPQENATMDACIRCHSLDSEFSHPIGITPSMSVPAHLPLDGGQVTCTTCHISQGHDTKGAGPMLRANMSAASFCTQCHAASGVVTRVSHGAGLDRAHFRRKQGDSPQGSTEFRAGLDEESRTCMSCHDGMVGRDAGTHSAAASGLFNQSHEHPIGVRYLNSASGNRQAQLVELRRLDSRIRLFDRAVGCGSCHSVYSKKASLLVVENTRSRLCLSCHVQ